MEAGTGHQYEITGDHVSGNKDGDVRRRPFALCLVNWAVWSLLGVEADSSENRCSNESYPSSSAPTDQQQPVASCGQALFGRRSRRDASLQAVQPH